MARIRTVKPDFWTSAQIMELSPMARLAFIGLWNFCDDAGIHPAQLKTLKARVFPVDALDIAPLMAELIDQGLLSTYEVEGREFWRVTGWHHQKIDRPSYKHPLPDGTLPTRYEDVRRAFDEYSTRATPRKGREVEVEGKGDKKTSSSSADDGGKVRLSNKEADALFDEWWQGYPRKVAKTAARKVWDRLGVDAAMSARMVQAIERQRMTEQWQRDNGQFIPHPATWLNQRRWEDEVNATTNAGGDDRPWYCRE